MAKYTREEMLHLRQSPIIVFHTPPLPDWISTEAITSLQAKTAKSSERQTLTRNPRTDDDLSAGSILKSAKGERGDLSSARSGRAVFEKDRSERANERERPRRGERDRLDKTDTTSRLTRDPRRPDDTDENFGSRRAKKPLSDLATFGRRRVEGVDELPSRTIATGKNATGPEWMSTSQQDVDDDDDARGKTVDDFERWKQSMKKNDGSGDAGLPPLPGEQIMSEAIEIKDEMPIKDVKPPPGFSSSSIRITEGSTDAQLLNSLFSTKESDATNDVSERPAVLPPGLSSVQNTASPNSPAAFSGSKSSGSSKFSKFFTQSQGHGSTQEPTTSSPAATSTRDPFAGLSFNSSGPEAKKPGNSDDAEGFERILAMLSSQSANSNMGAKKAAEDRPETITQGNFGYPPGQALLNNYGGHAERNVPSTDAMPIRPNKEQLAGRGPAYPLGEPALPGFNRGFEQTQYSPERQFPSKARDDLRNPPSAMMNHHTQNQDFFSSLLKQSGPPFAGPGRPPGGGPQEQRYISHNMSQSPPSIQPHIPAQRDSFMPREVFPSHGPTHLRDEVQPQYLRQHQGAQGNPPAAKIGSNGRNPAELDFLNQLMQEQRINSGSRDFPQYQSQAPGHGSHQTGKPQIPPQRLQGQPAYLTGIGSQPGPGWNGQYDIDPRIPNGGQYRP